MLLFVGILFLVLLHYTIWNCQIFYITYWTFENAVSLLKIKLGFSWNFSIGFFIAKHNSSLFLKVMPLMVPKEMRMQLWKIFDPIVTIWFVARRIPIRWRTQKLMDYIKCTLCCPSNLPCSYTRQKMNQHSIWHRTEIKQGDFWKTTLKKERQQIFFRFVAHTHSVVVNLT